MRFRYLTAVLGMLALHATHVAAAQDDRADSLARCEAAVFRRLQHAVRSHDTTTIANLLVYPVRVNLSQASHFVVSSRADFRKHFRDVLPDPVLRSILQQNPDSLFYSWRGAMVGDGEVWIASICSDQRATKCSCGITAINVPEAHRARLSNPLPNVR